MGKSVRIMSDSATAVAYVNNMGGSRSIICHKIAKQIWEWAKMQGVWISAAHIPRQKNILKQTKNLDNSKVQQNGCSQKKHSLSLQNNLARQI